MESKNVFTLAINTNHDNQQNVISLIAPRDHKSLAMTKTFLKASWLPTLILVILSCNLRASNAQTPPLVAGLSYTFHQSTCPQLESIVQTQLQTEFASDIGQAAGLLRLHFHDCFVQGCDGSVLLDGSASGPSERLAPPNLTLRLRAFTIIENLRRLVHAVCNQTVSCSDLAAIAARDAVVLVNNNINS